ncbi:phosphodiesterase [Falsiroseomonas sp. E2-1-a20]|uniref:phosphodiesterase n=1 Tax=Falsiroseomonas sp. E2-1-a20 TaxID=3239300 RepID=UPI003F372651
MSPFQVIHLTDLHLVPPGERLYGLDPEARLRAAVASIAERHGAGGAAPAAMVIITGDLANDGQPEAYALLREILPGLPCPWHLIPGNHDDRAALLAAFPDLPTDPDGHVQAAFETPVGRFLLLDTKEPGTHAGRLGERRLAWLAARLADDASPVFLWLHHPPQHVGIHVMDGYSLTDAAALWEVLRPHRDRIRHLFHGHLHRPMSGSWRGIPFSSLGGTNHQVALDLTVRPDVPGSHEPPVYGLVRITEDAVVVHIHEYLDTTNTFSL